MELITMSKEELKKVEIIRKLIEKQMTQKKAAKALNLSTRQVRRLLKVYGKEGEKGVVSKKRGASSNRATPLRTKNQGLETLRERYYDFGPTLAAEKLFELEGLTYSKETIRQWMIEDGLWKSKLKKEKKTHPQRPRRDSFGELIQIDGSPHAWFEERGPYYNLTVYIDDATGEYMKMFFSLTENFKAYCITTLSYFEEYGKPVAFYSDRHQIFKVNNKQNGEEVLSQFGRALDALNVELITANSPQAKGRVERANLTLQDRLVKELRLRDINTIEEANKFLDEEYKYTLSDKFSVIPREKSAHRAVKETKEELYRIFSKQESRVISRNLEVYHNNKIYQIETESQNLTMKNHKITVCTKIDDSVELLYKGRSLKYRVLIRPEKQVKVESSKTINIAVDNARKAQYTSSNGESIDDPFARY